jgi:ubiquinone/menaquinone biosynthesis C-methylase UbiE
VPGTVGEIWVEHWHRYHFAERWTRGREVLDVACGEGYGSALLARSAAKVTGVDISQAAIDHARAAYPGVRNLRYECASCTALPLADASVDVVVSFETLEHITEQEAFVDEVARVLRPGGVLLLSCPNKAEYTDRRKFQNAYHVKELYRDALAALVAARFPHSAWYGQRPTFYSVIAPEQSHGAQAQVLEVDEARPGEAAGEISSVLYYLIAASRDPAALARTPPALSVLADRNDWVRKDYEKVYRLLTSTGAERDALQAKVAELEKQVGQMRGEISRRRGFRYWLRLPLARLGLLKD